MNSRCETSSTAAGLNGMTRLAIPFLVAALTAIGCGGVEPHEPTQVRWYSVCPMEDPSVGVECLDADTQVFVKGTADKPDAIHCTWQCAEYLGQLGRWALHFERDYVSPVGELCYSEPSAEMLGGCGA